MKSIGFVFTFIVLLFFTSCQVKEATSDGGLISGHVPVTNKFTLDTPTSKTYVSGETITLTVSFPFDITVDTLGGSPRLDITVGGTSYFANYVSQPTLKKLSFSYTVVGGDNDTDGITVDSLDLNGSTLQFDKSGVATNCDETTLTSTTLSNVKVDTTGPTITAFSLTTVPGFYNVGETIYFSMTFSENVYVTGIPKFIINLATGGAVDVNYVTGSGSSILGFAFTIDDTHADLNGFDSITSPLDLGTGSIKDIVGNNSSLDFSAFTAAVRTASASVQINGQLPYVVDIVAPANGTYLVNQNLDFVFEFDRAVDVTGFPYLEITIDSTTRQAQYVSGTGTNFITFRYTTVPGDVDLDGITLATTLVQNGGTITDDVTPFTSYFASAGNNAFTVPNTSGVILNALQPMVTAVSRNIDTTLAMDTSAVDNIWIIGQTLYLTLTFNTNMYVTQTGGTPSVPITIGSTVRQATYLSGGNGQSSLIFTYTIQEGDLDTDTSIAVGSISLNGGVITDGENTNSLLTLPTAAVTSTTVDGVRPTILTITPPSDGVYSQVDPLNADDMEFTVNWSEPVNFSATGADTAYLSIDIGGTTVRAQYVSDVNTAATVHAPATLANRNDADGVVVNSPFAGSATIKDLAGNTISDVTFPSPTTTGIEVDTTAPTVTDIDPAIANDTYKAGEDLDFTVTFSEAVTTNVAGGRPRIPIVIGSTTRYLVPTANTTNTVHTFSYEIQATDGTDSNGVAVGTAIQHSATGYARDAGRNNVTGTFTAPDTSLINVDTDAPTLDSRTFSTARAYVSGETLQIQITYSEIVHVDTTGGTPYIAVDFDIGTLGTDNFVYSGGTGSATLTFSRLLDANHFDMNGLTSSVSAITLDSGTIQDEGRNNAPTTFTAVDLSGIYVTYPEVRLWTRSDFVNMAPPGGVTISSTGVASTEACGTGTCRTFDGDDSLSLTSALNTVSSVLMVFKTPAATTGFSTTYDIFDTDIGLTETFFGTDFDLSTRNADILINGAASSGTNHNVNLAVSTTNVLQVDFTATQSYNALLIETAFLGAIGEVIAIDGTLTAPQLDNIRNYLDSRF